MFPEKYDPWNFIALPAVWALWGYLWAREFISERRKSKPSLEQEL